MHIQRIAALCATLFALAGGNALAKDAEVSFPDLSYAEQPEGAFVSPESLRLIGNGMNKKQVYALLGVPHFKEGVFGVREWNYLLNFRRDGKVVTCQYQIQFDDDKQVDGTYWKDATCADFLKAS
jgi:outer membrane protein assembly factor BamE (lipoprotein component of BamABCDE complex)